MSPDEFPIRLNEPRERHYVMAHYAFRQICLDDSDYFFSLMASNHQQQFLNNLIQQVESNCPDDTTTLQATDFDVVTSRAGDHPLVLIKMPPPQAHAEAAFVGVVSTLDLTTPLDEQSPEVRYFTLELGEGEQGACFFFCQWHLDNHLNLGELQGECTREAFATLIEQRMEQLAQRTAH
ncbi:hypothetical protein FLL45_19120 [Aliikangiella marina]|uniref:Uncharacterized protein n=1 Tax=Aliikangiella marina TaxID=1712262 RepID=A0A545T504_9GAMM|nr:hypothetical protein [Aliikangiella marina]TQV72330.1 hypothetical protein FLL45_19120 [Aliikangiella marina]